MLAVVFSYLIYNKQINKLKNFYNDRPRYLQNTLKKKINNF